MLQAVDEATNWGQRPFRRSLNDTSAPAPFSRVRLAEVLRYFENIADRGEPLSNAALSFPEGRTHIVGGCSKDELRSSERDGARLHRDSTPDVADFQRCIHIDSAGGALKTHLLKDLKDTLNVNHSVAFDSCDLRAGYEGLPAMGNEPG